MGRGKGSQPDQLDSSQPVDASSGGRKQKSPRSDEDRHKRHRTQEISLTVQVSGQPSVSVVVPLSETVVRLRMEVAKQLDVDAGTQALLFREQHLANGRTVGQCGLRDGDIITCVSAAQDVQFALATRLIDTMAQEKNNEESARRHFEERRTLLENMKAWQYEWQNEDNEEEEHNRRKQCLLLTATEQGHHLYVREILTRGEPGEYDHHLEDCINMAVRLGHAECLRELLVAAGGAHNSVCVEDESVLSRSDRPLSQENEHFSPLFLAARDSHEQSIRVLLASGACKETALRAAAQAGHVGAINLLLYVGADVGARSRTGKTALHKACEEGHVLAAAALLDAGANLEAVSLDMSTSLHRACDRGHVDMVQALLKRGVDTTARGADGSTPLVMAVNSGYADVVELMLIHEKKEASSADASDSASASADAGGADSQGPAGADLALSAHTLSAEYGSLHAVHLAAMKGHGHVLRMLLEAVPIGNPHRKQLRERQTAGGARPLHYAAKYGREDAARILMCAGCDVEAACTARHSQFRPLHFAALNGQGGLVRILVEDSADVDARDATGRTPLHLAACKGFAGVVATLLEDGRADTGARTDRPHEHTPLHSACRYGHPGVVDMILRDGTADPNAHDGAGKTPLHWVLDIRRKKEDTSTSETRSLSNPSFVLQSATGIGKEDGPAVAGDGAGGTNSKKTETGSGSGSKHELGKGSTANSARNAYDDRGIDDDGGGSGIGVAAKMDNDDHYDVEIQMAVLDLLLRGGPAAIPSSIGEGDEEGDAAGGAEGVGAYVDARDNTGATAIFHAADTGQTEVLVRLLDAGADTDARDNTGQTALHKAADKGQTAAVTALLDAGADITLRGPGEETALRLASVQGHAEAVKVLLRARSMRRAGIRRAGGIMDSQVADCSHNYGNEKGRGKGNGGDVDDDDCDSEEEAARAGGSSALGSDGCGRAHGQGNGITALMWAAYGGHLDVVKMLLAEETEKVQKENRRVEAAERRRQKKLEREAQPQKRELGKPESESQSNSATAHLFHGDIDDNGGADEVEGEGKGDTAARNDDDDDFDSEEDDLELTQELDPETDVHQRSNAEGRSALHWAVKAGHVEVADALLTAGSDPDERDAAQVSILDVAVRGDSERLVRLLKRKGARMNARGGPHAFSALHRAAYRGKAHMVALLISGDVGASLAVEDGAGKTALHHAAERGYVECVKALLASDAMTRRQIDYADPAGYTPIALAFQRGHSEVTRLLMDAGASMHVGMAYSSSDAAHNGGSYGNQRAHPHPRPHSYSHSHSAAAGAGAGMGAAVHHSHQHRRGGPDQGPDQGHGHDGPRSRYSNVGGGGRGRKDIRRGRSRSRSMGRGKCKSRRRSGDRGSNRGRMKLQRNGTKGSSTSDGHKQSRGRGRSPTRGRGKVRGRGRVALIPSSDRSVSKGRSSDRNNSVDAYGGCDEDSVSGFGKHFGASAAEYYDGGGGGGGAGVGGGSVWSKRSSGAPELRASRQPLRRALSRSHIYSRAQQKHKKHQQRLQPKQRITKRTRSRSRSRSRLRARSRSRSVPGQSCWRGGGGGGGGESATRSHAMSTSTARSHSDLTSVAAGGGCSGSSAGARASAGFCGSDNEPSSGFLGETGCSDIDSQMLHADVLGGAECSEYGGSRRGFSHIRTKHEKEKARRIRMHEERLWGRGGGESEGRDRRTSESLGNGRRGDASSPNAKEYQRYNRAQKEQEQHRRQKQQRQQRQQRQRQRKQQQGEKAKAGFFSGSGQRRLMRKTHHAHNRNENLCWGSGDTDLSRQTTQHTTQPEILPTATGNGSVAIVSTTGITQQEAGLLPKPLSSQQRASSATEMDLRAVRMGGVSRDDGSDDQSSGDDELASIPQVTNKAKGKPPTRDNFGTDSGSSTAGGGNACNAQANGNDDGSSSGGVGKQKQSLPTKAAVPKSATQTATQSQSLHRISPCVTETQRWSQDQGQHPTMTQRISQRTTASE